MQYMLRYAIQMVCRETCHICWFEKINSHVVILNFSMEIQSTDASILISGTTLIRIQQCIHDYSVYHEGSVIVALIIASYPYIASNNYRIIPLVLPMYRIYCDAYIHPAYFTHQTIRVGFYI
jgi:hypothetical protein